MGSLLIVFNVQLMVLEAQVDPFGLSPQQQQQSPAEKGFETSAQFKVVPLSGWNPENIKREEWPDIRNPIEFNRRFDRPTKIWRVEGGFFGAFDGGEWGGALFFATDRATKWTRIIDTHIQDLERFEGDTFLASGGLAHMSASMGAAYLITRKETGEWVPRKVFCSESGVPRITGTSSTDSFLAATSDKLIVLELEHPLDPRLLFGIDRKGAVHYMGERRNEAPGKQEDAEKPAIKSKAEKQLEPSVPQSEVHPK